MNTVIIYWSKTGNTEKAARAVREGLEEGGARVEIRQLKKAKDVEDIDFFAYDLVCLGFPSYGWRPPSPIEKFLTSKFRMYGDSGHVKIGAPKVPGRNVLIFCTYSGPHTGIREAAPAVLYAGQFFEHLGFNVVGEWYIVGEFHGWEEGSIRGKLGDIRGRPNKEDLEKVHHDAIQLAKKIKEQKLNT
jgi:multimeric flavodoxin WrbA